MDIKFFFNQNQIRYAYFARNIYVYGYDWPCIQLTSKASLTLLNAKQRSSGKCNLEEYRKS